MGWQMYVVLILVAVAAVYVLRRLGHTWFGATRGCSKGCGCSASAADKHGAHGAATFVPAEQLSLRRRPSNSA
jgi:hypothetical protein